jgi:ribonuclease HI
MKMKLNGRKFFHLMMASILLLAGVMAIFSHAGTVEAKPKTDAQTIHDAMRKLWEDHITWTRLTIVSLSNDLSDTDPTVQRLLQNQTDIGNAIKPYYGDEAWDHLTALLKDHILIAAEIIQAEKSGDTAAQSDATARWYANADDIAVFLNSANPKFWPLDEMKDMMREHLDLTLQEAVAYLTGDHAASIAAYDQVHLQALDMADMLSDGIIRQFPKKFK